MNTSQGTVTNAAKIAGVSFDRSDQLSKAAELSALDAKELRTRLETSLLRAGVQAAEKIPFVDAREGRDLAVIAGVAHDKSVNQERMSMLSGKAPADRSDMSRYLSFILGGPKDEADERYVQHINAGSVTPNDNDE
ncbi:hypothetical protein CH282_15300 [Rhodococcus sp. 06-418-1B]|nr:hypothetical protein CH282_15300 [Rhodococcus sp. 06-418-1B]